MRSKDEILLEVGRGGWWIRCKRTIERGTNGGRRGTSCRGRGGQKRAVGQELSGGRKLRQELMCKPWRNAACLLVCPVMAYSIFLHRAPRTSSPESGSHYSELYPLLSQPEKSQKCPTDWPTGQPCGGIFLIKCPSFQMTLAWIKLTYINLASTVCQPNIHNQRKVVGAIVIK